MSVLKNTENLFGTNWIEKSEFWNMPINSFCQKLENLTTEAKDLIKDLKETFMEIFSGVLGRYNKMMAKFKLKDGIQPVFKK